MSANARRLTGYGNDSVQQQNHQQRNHLHPQSLYDDGMDDYDVYRSVDDYDDDTDSEEEEEDVESVGSVLSIPDPNIDFDLVYALHTFAATVEGQASVVKGDALTLLDDSNSYWWLVKVLKTSEIGYIPAENIETPYERLARLNSHRNIELTQRDIQDAFPAPPSTKAPSNKKVKMSKGVKFQAQVIFGSDDDEDFEEEYEEWHETIRSDSDTDDDTTDSDEDDEDDYYDDVRLYTSGGYGQSSVDNYNRSQQHQEQVWPTPPQNSQQQQQYHPQQQINSQQQQSIQQQQQQQQQQQSSQQQPSSGLRNFDLEPSETIKYSLTPAIARGSADLNSYANNGNNASGDTNKQSKASKLESILAADEPEQQQQRRGSKDKKEKSGPGGGLRKLFSRGKDSKDKKQRKGSTDKQSIQDSIDTISISSQSTSHSDRERMNSVDSSMQHQHNQYHHHSHHHNHHPQQQQQPHSQHLHPQQNTLEAPVQPTVLKIFAGNVRFGAEYKIAHAYPSTSAAELIQQALNHFNIEDHQSQNTDAHLDYFLTVKGVDGDESTLVPMDKPLAIYHSLMSHLNVPMPSLKKARRISALMGGTNGESTHIGGPKEEDSSIEEVRFYLHTKAKRPEETYMSIKVSLFASEIGGQTSILKFDQARVDKLVTVPTHATVGDVTSLLLDKFHVLNGIVDGPDVDEKIKSLRLQGAATEGDVVKYRLALSKQGHEFTLAPSAPIRSAFGENLPPVHHRRNSSNPDRSSIASLSSVITPSPQPDETYFILRSADRKQLSPSNQQQQQQQQQQLQQQQQQQALSRPVRPPRPARQDTPMPRGGLTPSPATPSEEVPTIHPLSISQDPQQQGQSQQPQIFDEPESAVDVLMKLDLALDNLAHTRNSNEPLTEAIVASQNDDEPQLQHATPRTASRQDLTPRSASRQEIVPIPSRSASRQELVATPTSRSASRQELVVTPTSRSPSRQQQEVNMNSTPAINTQPSQSPSPQPEPQQRQIQQVEIDEGGNDYDNDIISSPKTRTRKNGSIVESLLFSQEFGMNELMVLIRGAARYAEENENTASSGRSRQPPIRSEISEVFKDTYSRIDQLEKELDRMMSEAVKVYH